jgi:uncharacterized membrane protein YphA (DoxX/SURF4 family)
MRLRDSIGLNLAPFVLRLALAAVFIWAGAGTFFAHMDFTPEQAARLAQMGVNIPGGSAAPLPVTPPQDEPEADAAGDPEEGSPTASAPETAPDAAPDAAPLPTPSAADYPDGASMPQLYMLAIGLDDAAHPGFNADGEQLDPIWPPAATGGKWALWTARAVAATELVCGILMIAGFLTRPAALALACVMACAMWLTQFGPAIQHHDTILGFLPNHPAYDMAWQDLLFQFTLFGAALAVLLLGAGAMSIDAIIFGAPGPRRGRPPREDDDD